MNWKDIEPRTIKLRNDLLATLNAIRKESITENLPEIGKSVSLAEDLLAKPSYDLVVCGEVKKGKSTFINAIIGQELLPTGVKETTSQVFRISNSEKESFFLVFTDGTTESINRNELTRYGSQVDADIMGEPRFHGKQIDYIQINIPIEFLPMGVSIVDTPGLGALYKSHELITNRYVVNAAAVVFVFDPNQPLVQQEKLFLEKVFSVTPYVMFVMTKVDLFDEEHWVAQIRRSESLLKETFGSQCYAMPKVFPIASNTLIEATQQKEADAKEELVDFSYFPAAQAELMKLMYQTVGISRTKFACDEAQKHSNYVLKIIDEQLKMIAASTKEEQEKLKGEKLKRKAAFEELWGPASIKRKDVNQEVQKIINSVNNRATQITSTSGAIYKKYHNQIDQLGSIEAIKSFASNITKNIIADVSNEWQVIVTSAQRDIMLTLSSLKTKMEEFSDSVSFSTSDSISVQSLSGAEKFQSYKSKYFDAAITTGVGATLLSLAGIAVAPFAPVIFIGAIIYGILGGGLDAEKKEVEKNKVLLKNNLLNLMNEINAQMFHVPMQGAHQSMIQKFNTDLAFSVNQATSAAYDAEKARFEKEIKRLDDQARLSNEQKQNESIKVNNQRKVWIDIKGQLSVEENLLKTIHDILVTE